MKTLKSVKIDYNWKPSKKEIQELKERLRYIDPKNIAKDFIEPGERDAIKAVFKWLSLNAIVARSLKNPGHVSVLGFCNGKDYNWDKLVLDEEVYRKAEKVLGIKDVD